MLFGAISQYFGHPIGYVDFFVFKYLTYFHLHIINTMKNKCTRDTNYSCQFLQILICTTQKILHLELSTVLIHPREFHGRNNVAVRRMT